MRAQCRFVVASPLSARRLSSVSRVQQLGAVRLAALAARAERSETPSLRQTPDGEISARKSGVQIAERGRFSRRTSDRR